MHARRPSGRVHFAPAQLLRGGSPPAPLAAARGGPPPHTLAQTFQGRSDWDEYKPTRVAQGFELARFVQHTRRSPLAVLMGDLNSAPDDQVLDLLRVAGRLRDAFVECNPRAAGYTYGAVNNSWGPNGVGGPIAEGGGDPTALPARTHAGNTDNSGNSGGRGRGRSRSEDAVAGVGAGADEEEGRPAATWADRDVDPDATRALRDRPTRMDYVLFSAAGDDCGAGGDTGSEGSAATPDGGGAGFHAQGCAPAAGWSVRSCRIVRWRTPDGVSVSDHFGVAATFAFDACVGTPPPGTVCAVPRMATAGTGAGARSDASPPVLLPSHAASVEGGDRGAGRAAYAYACDRGIGVAIPPSPDAASVECSDGSPGGGGGGVSSSARRLAVGSCPAWEVHSQLPPPVAQASGAHRDGGSSLPALTSVPLVDGLDLEVHVLRECQAIIVSGLTDAQRRKGGHARRASRAVLVMAAYGLVLAASAVAGPGAGVEGGDVVVKAGHGGMGPAAGGVGPATPPHPAPAPGGGDVVNGAAATALSALALVVPILGAYATVELLLCWFAVGDEISGFEEVREQMEVCSVYRRALRSAASAS